MAKDTPWKPGDGAEQMDPSQAAQETRVGTAHFTPQHRSDEPDQQPRTPDEPPEVPGEPFDRDYAAWRGVNGNRLDADYRRWRAETAQPFSRAFLEWADREARKRS
jgi:hypothetical protein